MKINALLVALLLGVSSFVPVQAATHKSKGHAVSHSGKKRVKQAKHAKARARTLKTKKS